MTQITHSALDKELEEKGELWYSFRGRSMLPMLREDRDLVRIVPVTRPLRKYDLPLYRRSEGVYVLHRIIRITPDCYYIRGDNTYSIEKCNGDDRIIGVMESFTRNGRTISAENGLYKCYVRFHCASYSLRWALHMGTGIIRKLKKCFEVMK